MHMITSLFHRPGPPDGLSVKDQTTSLFLPLALLLLRTSLPPLVAIRALKPCVLFLFVFVIVTSVFFIS